MAPLAIKGYSDWHRTTKQTWKKAENQQTMNKIKSILKVVRINQHGKFQPIPWLETASLTCFTKSKCCQNEQNQQIWDVMIFMWCPYTQLHQIHSAEHLECFVTDSINRYLLITALKCLYYSACIWVALLTLSLHSDNYNPASSHAWLSRKIMHT